QPGKQQRAYKIVEEYLEFFIQNTNFYALQRTAISVRLKRVLSESPTEFPINPTWLPRKPTR
ncbi:MAG: hypothetical protein KGO92_06895, partial [Bacteroidota bacterium]|nr:hypothetical protein [Bacteroidota bacterium]